MTRTMAMTTGKRQWKMHPQMKRREGAETGTARAEAYTSK